MTNHVSSTLPRMSCTFPGRREAKARPRALHINVSVRFSERAGPSSRHTHPWPYSISIDQASVHSFSVLSHMFKVKFTWIKIQIRSMDTISRHVYISLIYFSSIHNFSSFFFFSCDFFCWRNEIVFQEHFLNNITIVNSFLFFTPDKTLAWLFIDWMNDARHSSPWVNISGNNLILIE